MKKRVIALAVVFLLLIQVSFPVYAAFSTEIRDSVAVVYTCLDFDAGEHSFGWGTGFFVGALDEPPTYLVTNYHVVDNYVDYGKGELISGTFDGVEVTGRSKIRVYFDSEDYEEAYLVDADASKDIAILKMADATEKRRALPLLSPTDDMVGSTVYAIGYPGLAENIFSASTTKWGVSDASVTSGVFSRIFNTQGTGVRNIQSDIDFKSGNSGGPLVNDDGAVIGVTTWGVSNEGEQINYATSIDEAIFLLQKNGIYFEFANSGPSPVLIAVIVALIVVIIAVIVFLIVYLNKSKKKQPNGGKGRKGGTPSVRSFASQHQGMRVPVQGQLMIGRNPADCALVFREGTPGISGRHCTVSFDAATGDFIVTDLRSTYGTFMKNGQKLTPGVAYRMKPGDCFYLGEAANMMCVEME